jgi:hypothetical protein
MTKEGCLLMQGIFEELEILKVAGIELHQGAFPLVELM